MIDREHIAPDRLIALKDGLLSEEELILTLEHLGECEQCAAAFAESFGKHQLLELPAGFRQAVFVAVNRQGGTSGKKEAKPAAGSHPLKSAAKKRELYRYGFRVSIAACITLLLLFTGTVDYGINFSRSIRADLSEVHVITENLRGFSDRLIHFEFTKYIKEEL